MKREEMTVGRRVRLTRDITRFPWFEATAGALGTVEENEEAGPGVGLVAVKMDDPLPNCTEWDNCIHFVPEDEDEWDNPPFEEVQ